MDDAVTGSRAPALIIAGRVRVDPAKRAEANAAIVAMMEATRAEPGCISYVISGDLESPGTLHIFEQWASQEALDAHFASPHMATFQQSVGRVGVLEMEIRKYAIASVGPVS